MEMKMVVAVVLTTITIILLVPTSEARVNKNQKRMPSGYSPIAVEGCQPLLDDKHDEIEEKMGEKYTKMEAISCERQQVNGYRYKIEV